MARKQIDTQQSISLPDAVVERIRASIARCRPGLWAEESNYGPACICGLKGDGMPLGTGYQFNPERIQACPRHTTPTETT